MKKKLFITIVFLLMIGLCFLVNAEEDTSRVIRGVGSYAYQQNVDELLNDFNETNEGWDSDTLSSDVTLAEKIDTFPFNVLTGNGSLIVSTENAKSQQKNYISKTFDTPIDLSQYSVISSAVNCSAVDGGEYTFDIELYSGREVFRAQQVIDDQSWNAVFVDISGFKMRNSIDKIRISVSYECGDVPVSFFEYYVDNIAVTKDKNVVNRVRYSAESYNITGGVAELTEDGIKVTPKEDVLYVDLLNFCYSSLNGANSLSLKGVYEGSLAYISLYVQDENGEYTLMSLDTVKGESGVINARLPLYDDALKNIRLEFTGNVKSFTIENIGLFSTFVEDNGTIGVIDTCAINSNTEEIIIRGMFEKENWQEYLQKDIYLFSHDLSEEVTGDGLKNATYLAKSKVTSSDFIFRISYAGEVDKRQFLHRKYTVAVKSENGFEIVDYSKCITNPDSFLKNTSKISEGGSGKGVYGAGISFMQEMGVSDTVVWVDIGKFFLLEDQSGSKFECGGVLYYYNNEYAETLNKTIRNYGEKNINVTLCIVVSDTGNEMLNKLLIYEGADLSADYCAYNTKSAQGLSYLRAFSEYWASKYAESGYIKRIVFGDSVSRAYDSYNMGEKLLSSFTEEYAKGLRTVYNAVKSYAPYINIYTFVDEVWDNNYPFDLYTRYDSKAFLESLGDCISSDGNINWGIAQNLYPYLYDDYFSYRDKGLEYTEDSDRVSFKNIEVVTDWLKNNEKYYGGASRNYIIIEKTYFSKLDEKEVTADYVYNCYKALNTYVSAYITDRTCNYNGAMKYIDTSDSLSYTRFAAEVLGVATWESVIKGFSIDNVSRKNITRSQIELSRSDIKGSVEIYNFGDNRQGWLPYGFSENISAGSSLGDKRHLMWLMLGEVPSGESRGLVKKFSTPYDMSLTPIMNFEINAATLPQNVSYLQMTVMLISGNDVYEATGMVKGGSWLSVYCDFSSFAGLSKIDEIRILFYADENYYDSPQIFIGSINGMSTEYDSETLFSMLNPEDVREKQLENIKTYAYPVLVCVILVSICLFVWRRVLAKKEK